MDKHSLFNCQPENLHHAPEDACSLNNRRSMCLLCSSGKGYASSFSGSFENTYIKHIKKLGHMVCMHLK